MKDLGHGANVDNMAKKFGKNENDIIDFSSNVNPHIISDLGKYVLEGLEKSRSYPDINYTNLRNNISDYIKVDSELIIPGNGATEIIYLLMKSIKRRLAILNPTFSEYGRGAKLNNLEIIDFHLKEENNFSIDLDEIQKNMDKFDSLFVCNPNNPNGKVKDLNELLDLMIENDKLLIVDNENIFEGNLELLKEADLGYEIEVGTASFEEIKDDFIDFFMTPFMWYVRFCKWLVYPTYDNGFNQKIAYTGGEVWVIRILAIVAVLFIMGIIMVIIMETIKQYKKMWNEISQMFLIGSLSGIAVLGDVTRKYLPVNLILLFILINMGIMLLRIYLRKKFDYM